MKKFLKRLKLNNKGFTLVEILATVTVIGILSGTAIYSGIGTMNKAHVDYCTSLSDNMVIAGRDYFNDNKLMLPNDYEKTSCVTLQKLISDRYVEDMKDYEDNTCDSANSKVCAIKETNETFFYNPILSCNKCITANTLSQGAEAPIISYNPNSKTVDNQDINVTINMIGNSSKTKKIVSYSYEVYKISSTSSDISSGTLVKGSSDYKKYTGDPKVKLTDTGIYKIRATAINEDGRKNTATSGAYQVKRTFTTNAECDSKAVVATVSGWSEKTWKNGTFTMKFTKKGKVGSYSVYVKKSDCGGKTSCGSSWSSETREINKASTNKTYKSEKDSAKYIIKVIAYASNNDSSASCTYTKEYWVDNEKPKCETSYTAPPNYPSTSVYHDKWTNQNVTLEGRCSSDTGGSGCNTSSTTNKIFSTSMNKKVAPPVDNKVKDIAGNFSEPCNKVDVKIDKIKPTCDKITQNNNTWTNTSTTLGVNCKDTGASILQSGCKQTSFTRTISSEGLYQTGFSIPVSDWAGNVNTSCSTSLKFTKKIDKTKPDCGSVTGASSWSKTSNSVSVKCSDTKGTNQGNSGCTSSSFSKSLSSEGEVEKSVSWTIKDKAGNSRNCSANNVKKMVDKTPPDKNSVSCVQPTNSCGRSQWWNTAYTIKYSATDPKKGNTPGASGVKTFTLKSNNNGTQTNSGTYSVKKKEGNYPITVVKVCDNAGNCTNVNQQKCSAMVDTTPAYNNSPYMECSGSTTGKGYHAYFRMTYGDNLSGPYQRTIKCQDNMGKKPSVNGTAQISYGFIEGAGSGCQENTNTSCGGWKKGGCSDWNDKGKCIEHKYTRSCTDTYTYECSMTCTINKGALQDAACNNSKSTVSPSASTSCPRTVGGKTSKKYTETDYW